MAPLVTRSLTALIAVALVLGLLWAATAYNADWLVLGVLTLVTAFACWEYAGLAQKIGVPLSAPFFSLLSLLYLLGAGLLAENVAALLFALIFLIALAAITPPGQRMENLLWSLLGFAYIPLMLQFLYAIYAANEGLSYLALLLALVWAYDTGAYLAGSLWGRHKLAPALSPKKSWEGVAGGWLLAFVVGLASSLWLDWHVTLGPWVLHALLLSLLVGIFSQVGDLFESKLKRLAGVKDAGALFPGHGGMLDRIDGLLIATPVFLFYLRVVLQWL